MPAADGSPAATVEGLIVATGFFRHGVLLTPAAAVICRELMDGVEDARWNAFRPARFSTERLSTERPSTERPAAAHAASPRSAAPYPVTFDPDKETA
jgi:glycine oxidase